MEARQRLGLPSWRIAFVALFGWIMSASYPLFSTLILVFLCAAYVHPLWEENNKNWKPAWTGQDWLAIGVLLLVVFALFRHLDPVTLLRLGVFDPMALVRIILGFDPIPYIQLFQGTR